MNIVPDESAETIQLKDIQFQDHGGWKPEDGMVYHYFSVNHQRYVLISSINNYGGGLTVFYDGGYSSLIVSQQFRHDMKFKASPNPSVTYDRYGVMLIDGKRLA